MRLEELHASRPRHRFACYSLVLLALLVLTAWLSADIAPQDLFSARRLANLQRFVGEIRPGPEAWQTLFKEGGPAAVDTLWLSIAGISLAGLVAAILLPLVSSQLARAQPFEGMPNPGWRLLRCVVQTMALISRATPEYLLAFLFVGVLGANAWPLVLALAVHNLGILVRLGSEVVDNYPVALPRTMAALGQSRSQLYLCSLLPAVLPRFLVYFFYRWETCVRDSTVLGTLGFATLGYSIRDARSRQALDVMVLFMLLAAGLVLLGDFVSSAVRRRLRD
jgi:phosphonate transport system permease protein